MMAAVFLSEARHVALTERAGLVILYVDMAITRRHVHPRKPTIRKAIERAWVNRSESNESAAATLKQARER